MRSFGGAISSISLQNRMGPRLLVSDWGTFDRAILRWRLRVHGNMAVEFGVVPSSLAVSFVSRSLNHLTVTCASPVVAQQIVVSRSVGFICSVEVHPMLLSALNTVYAQCISAHDRLLSHHM